MMRRRTPCSMKSFPLGATIISLGVVVAVVGVMASQPVRDAYLLFYFIEGMSSFMCL